MFVESQEYKGYKIEYLDYLEYPKYLRYGYYTFKILNKKFEYEITTGSAQNFELAQAQAKKKVDYLCQIIT